MTMLNLLDPATPARDTNGHGRAHAPAAAPVESEAGPKAVAEPAAPEPLAPLHCPITKSFPRSDHRLFVEPNFKRVVVDDAWGRPVRVEVRMVQVGAEIYANPTDYCWLNGEDEVYVLEVTRSLALAAMRKAMLDEGAEAGAL